MKIKSLVKHVAAVLALMTVGALGAGCGPAIDSNGAAPDLNAQEQAIATSDLELTYYSDDTFGEQVGGYYRGCYGGQSQWGVQTAYYYKVSYLCGQPSPGTCSMCVPTGCSPCPN